MLPPTAALLLLASVYADDDEEEDGEDGEDDDVAVRFVLEVGTSVTLSSDAMPNWISADTTLYAVKTSSVPLLAR